MPTLFKRETLDAVVVGNTVGEEIWSDGRRIAPMCPELSSTQKCPHCGQYFFLSKVEPRTDYEELLETGWLTFEEAMEARHKGLEQFNEEVGCETIEITELGQVLMIIAWAYNDIYRSGNTPTREQFIAFMERFLEFPAIIEDDLLLAEMFREIGDRKRCQ